MAIFPCEAHNYWPGYQCPECKGANVTTPATTPADALKAADALEAEYLAVANGTKKPGKMDLEPLVRAVQALRALAAPLSAPEPVAVIGSDFSLFWIGSGPIAPIIKRHGLKVGDKLYASPGKAEAEDAARYRWALERIMNWGNPMSPEDMSARGQKSVAAEAYYGSYDKAYSAMLAAAEAPNGEGSDGDIPL